MRKSSVLYKQKIQKRISNNKDSYSTSCNPIHIYLKFFGEKKIWRSRIRKSKEYKISYPIIKIYIPISIKCRKRNPFKN